MSITLIVGPMFASKTSRLIGEYRRLQSIKNSAILINYVDDNRYGEDNFVYSHDKNKVPCIKVRTLSETNDKQLMNCDVILINEGQFFSDLIEFCLKWCEQYGKTIVVAGLDGDYLRRPFGKINELMSLADDVIKVKAYCKKCMNRTEALFTKRLTNDTEEVLIGTDIYMPVCRKHYLE